MLLVIFAAGFILMSILYADAKLKCESSKYWDGVTCNDKKQYSEPCQSSNECTDSQSLFCINGTCSCYSKYTHYSFTGKKCVNKKHEKEECSFSVECLEPMTCVNKICQCNRFEYFNEIKCINKTLVNSPCQTDNTCHVDLGLTCQNFLCQCDQNKQFWSSDLNMCVDLLKYGTTGCKSDQQCHTNLICNSYPILNKCSCPIKSSNGMCDCKRNNDGEFFWNGSDCVEAGGKMSKCKKDYECSSSLVCLDRISRCAANSFFSSFLRSSNHANHFIQHDWIKLTFFSVAIRQILPQF